VIHFVRLIADRFYRSRFRRPGASRVRQWR
jgi:hypothetical protein